MKIITKSVFILLIGTICISSNLFSQENQTLRKTARQEAGKKALGNINGKVIDATTNEELQYVNIAMLRQKDSSIVNGTISDEKGKFTIKEGYGKYLLRLTFIGYKDNFISIDVKNENIALGTIKLSKSAEALKGVVITAERSMMEYQLDKRVINVDKNLVSAGGSASDVLENVPSVSIDENGGVTLRGSSNVNILIDGRPSELLGNDLATILQQIPASTIESIEIITNPSAKYNPEGMSGIINIKLKEKGNMGLNGNVSISGGAGLNNNSDTDKNLFPQTSLSAGLNYSNKKFALFLNGDMRYFDNFSYGFSDKSTFSNNNTINILQNRYSDEKRLGRGFKIGGDWYIDKQNTLSLSYNLRSGGSFPNENNEERLFSWQKDDSLNILNPNNYYGLEESSSKMLFQNFTLSYEKKFDKKDQILTLDANWNVGSFTNETVQTRSFDINSPENYYLKNASNSSNDRAIITLNYAHPFSENIKLETGYNLNYLNTNSVYDYFNSRDGVRNDSMSYDFNYKEQVHAVYATLGYSINKRISSQLGLRAEEVIRDGYKTQNNEKLIFPKDEDTKNYFSIFPTLHISYNITGSQSAQISYSRRINRPKYWSLSPSIDINNPANIRFGNPDLMPEYTDAFEIGYNKIFNKTSIFASLYYRITNDEITNLNFLWNEANAIKYGFEWVWDVAGVEYSDGIRIASTSKNLAKSSNYGAELIIDQQITKWWKVNLSGNIFGNYADGREFGGKLVETLNWDSKINSSMTLPKNWVIQISGQYQPKRENIQGYSTKMYWMDLAVKKDVLNKKGSISIRFSDIFNTRKRTSYTFTENYNQYSIRQRTSQVLIFSFNYRFGITDREQMQRQKKRQQEQENGSGLESIDE